MKIIKLLIILILCNSVSLSITDEDYNSEFINKKVTECESLFNNTRRQHLEDRFFLDTLHEINTIGLSRKELDERISGFNERLFDDLLEFCSVCYKYKPFIIPVVFGVGALKIHDRLMERFTACR